MSIRSAIASLFRKRHSTVDVATAKALLSRGATLIDVRTAAEWRAGHAPQAKHIPLDRIPVSGPRIRKDRPVVVMCHSGGRSAAAARIIAEQGYEIYSLRGGITAWERAGEPVH